MNQIIELPEKHVFVFELCTAGFAEYCVSILSDPSKDSL
jgi:hypothetical protein